MITLRPMTKAEYPAYRAFLEELYAAQSGTAYDCTLEHAAAWGRSVLAALLPAGFETPDASFFNIVNEDNQQVGAVWLAVQDEFGQKAAFLRYIHIDEKFRCRGYAGQALQAVEDVVKTRGFSALLLNVYGFNEQALRLYRRHGFSPLKMTMTKTLSS